MLVTVSGMVGSGKTTAATQVRALLELDGVDVCVLRFQALPCFTLLRSGLRPKGKAPRKASGNPAESSERRWIGYQRKRLTLIVASVYVARVIAFRTYRAFWPSQRCYILNRYFYDLFTHFHLTARSERLYFSILRALMPVPDIAILVVAAAGTIATRRPSYSEEYLSQSMSSYAGLRALFPELVEVRTDSPESSTAALRTLISTHLAKAGYARP